MGVVTHLTEVAAGILIRGATILLAHRHPARLSYPDVWDFPGGHLDEGETPAAALARELREELGIEPTVPATAWRRAHGDGDYQMHLFLVRQWSGEIINAEPTEHDDLAWFGAADVEELELAHDSFRELIRDALKTT